MSFTEITFWCGMGTFLAPIVFGAPGLVIAAFSILFYGAYLIGLAIR